MTLVGSALFSSARLLDCRDLSPIAIRREEMVEEQRRREQEEARNLRAAQDLSRMSLSPANSGPPPPPQHYPPPSFSVRNIICHVSHLQSQIYISLGASMSVIRALRCAFHPCRFACRRGLAHA